MNHMQTVRSSCQKMKTHKCELVDVCDGQAQSNCIGKPTFCIASQTMYLLDSSDGARGPEFKLPVRILRVNTISPR